MERKTTVSPAFSTPYGVQATKGHLSSNGGLRGHSVGEHFPVILGMQGSPHNRLYWFAQAPDGAEMLFPSYKAASDAAEAWHMLRRSFTRCSERVGLSLDIRKVKSNEDEEGGTHCESFDLSEGVEFDFFGLYAVNAGGFSEWIADNESALVLGRLAAFLARAFVVEEHKRLNESLRLWSGRGISMTCEEFLAWSSQGSVDTQSNVMDYLNLDSAMTDRLGADLWGSLAKYY